MTQEIAVPIKECQAHPYHALFEQYIDEASFLWVLRSIAVHQPHYDKHDLAELERRVQANLDGLMAAPEEAWQACLHAIDAGDVGEVFTVANVAFRSLEPNKIQCAVEMGLSDPVCTPGLISAIGWLPDNIVHPWIKKFLHSKDLDHKFLAIAACSVRREYPGDALSKFLKRDDCLKHKNLYCRCLRIIGELKRHELRAELEVALQSSDDDFIFWASWSAVLLGDKTKVEKLKRYVMADNIHQSRAVQIAFNSLTIEEARQWISELAQDASQARTVIKGTGILGDPHAVNWLIVKMREPQYSRLAGEAFSLITGIDLKQRQLDMELPDLTEQLPNDDPQDNEVALDEDENLPWPNAEKIAALWQQYGSRFEPGRRYFLGKPAHPDSLTYFENNGLQRQRQLAAVALAIENPASLLVNASNASVLRLGD